MPVCVHLSEREWNRESVWLQSWMCVRSILFTPHLSITLSAASSKAPRMGSLSCQCVHDCVRACGRLCTCSKVQHFKLSTTHFPQCLYIVEQELWHRNECAKIKTCENVSKTILMKNNKSPVNKMPSPALPAPASCCPPPSPPASPFLLLQRSLPDPALLLPEKLLVKLKTKAFVLSGDTPVPLISHRFLVLCRYCWGKQVATGTFFCCFVLCYNTYTYNTEISHFLIYWRDCPLRSTVSFSRGSQNKPNKQQKHKHMSIVI